MAIKMEKSTIIINEKEYNFLKPTAVDIIEIEDKCFRPDGSLDQNKYNELMLGLVSKKLKIDDLVTFNRQVVTTTTGEEIELPRVAYTDWIKSLEAIGEFSRVKLAKTALACTGVTGEITFGGFKYADIDALAMAYFSMYDTTELKRVVDEIATFCV